MFKRCPSARHGSVFGVTCVICRKRIRICSRKLNKILNFSATDRRYHLFPAEWMREAVTTSKSRKINGCSPSIILMNVRPHTLSKPGPCRHGTDSKLEITFFQLVNSKFRLTTHSEKDKLETRKINNWISSLSSAAGTISSLVSR